MCVGDTPCYSILRYEIGLRYDALHPAGGLQRRAAMGVGRMSGGVAPAEMPVATSGACAMTTSTYRRAIAD